MPTTVRHAADCPDVIIDELGSAPLEVTGTQLQLRFIAAAYERRSIGSPPTTRSRTGVGSSPSRPPLRHCFDRLLRQAVVVATDGESFRMREAKTLTTRARL